MTAEHDIVVQLLQTCKTGHKTHLPLDAVRCMRLSTVGYDITHHVCIPAHHLCLDIFGNTIYPTIDPRNITLKHTAAGLC